MRKVLVVEDNITLLHMQRDWLENAGYRVMTAIDEPSAHKWLNKESFDLVNIFDLLPHQMKSGNA